MDHTAGYPTADVSATMASDPRNICEWNFDGSPKDFWDDDVVTAIQQLAARYRGPAEFWTETSLPVFTASFSNLQVVPDSKEEDDKSDSEPHSAVESESEAGCDVDDDTDEDSAPSTKATRSRRFDHRSFQSATTIDSLPSLGEIERSRQIDHRWLQAATTMDSLPSLGEIEKSPSRKASSTSTWGKDDGESVTTTSTDASFESERKVEDGSEDVNKDEAIAARLKWKQERMGKREARRLSGKMSYGDWLRAQNEQYI